MLFKNEYNKAPQSWTPDGKILLFDFRTPSIGFDIWKLAINGEEIVASPFIDSPSNEVKPTLSPNGKWLAYMSDKTGSYEVYVMPFADSGSLWQISTEGGQDPVWSRTGHELFYRIGDKMMAVEYSEEPEFTPANPRLLFEGKYIWGGRARSYDVTSDGQRFLMVKSSESTLPPSQVNVILNWYEELLQLVPVQR